tara:strand:- start:6648 stop:6788 length:141 start_codon:yes stop_codon:yes gene_type:complete
MKRTILPIKTTAIIFASILALFSLSSCNDDDSAIEEAAEELEDAVD